MAELQCWATEVEYGKDRLEENVPEDLELAILARLNPATTYYNGN